MESVGRNEPCPCGSGKKYKKCCGRETDEGRPASSRTEGVAVAIDWLRRRHKAAVLDAIRGDFFGDFEDEELARLDELHETYQEMVTVHSMEWVLCDGLLSLRGDVVRAIDKVLGSSGPSSLTSEQRRWLQAMAGQRLRLYEITEVVPGESLVLRDLLDEAHSPVRVQERSGSESMSVWDVIGARVVPWDDHFEISGPVYDIPREDVPDILAEVEGLAEPVAGEELAASIIANWVGHLVTPIRVPDLVDRGTSEPLMFATDCYDVGDWDRLATILGEQPDVQGDREQGWARLQRSGPNPGRTLAAINIGKKPNSVEVFYRTLAMADGGKTWLEGLAGSAIAFRRRQCFDPKAYLKGVAAGDLAPRREEHDEKPIPPEVQTQLFEAFYRREYANWAREPIPALDDRTPADAARSPEGKRKVVDLLKLYENNEARQARDQGRRPIRFDFLWQQAGLDREKELATP